MSDDELEKLAAEMQNISPSETARKRGMDAAMAAFDMEFAREAVSESIEEKNSNLSQGLADAPRPTGQSTLAERAQTLGRDSMGRFNNVMSNFKFTPRAAMMGGSCMAALVVSMVFYDAGQFGTAPVSNDAATQVAVVEPMVVGAAPTVTTNAKEETEKNKIDEKSFETVTEMVVVNPMPAEYPAESVVESPVETSSAIAGKTSPPRALPKTVDAKTDTASNTMVVERRVVKTPAQTMERTVPSITKMETRRVIKTPASTTERVTPAITKEVTRRVEENGEFKSITETVVVTPQSVEYVNVPAEYETVMEPVVTQEASTELVSVPATFEIIRETIEVQADGTRKVISSETVPSVNSPTPPQISRQTALTVNRQAALSSRRSRVAVPIAENSASFAPLPKKLGGLTVEEFPSEPIATGRVNTNDSGQFTVFDGVSNEVVESTQTVVNQTGEILARVLIPAKYKTITKQVLVSPAKSEKVIIPAVTKDIIVKLANDDGTFREVVNKVVVEDERIDYVITPAKYETRSERILVEPAREEWNPGTQADNAGQLGTKLAMAKPAPPKYILRDDDGNVVREFENRDAFEIYKANLPTSVEETPVSTFSVDVDTASYSFLRASLNRGQLPPRNSIRLEEMINYFPYDYVPPKSADEPFKANVTVTPNPWNADTKLMHIGIKGYVPPANERPRSNIVFLIDTSGSMNQANKLPLLINSFKLLLNTLGDDDTVSIVTYAGRAGTVLEPTPASDKHKIKEALTRLRAGGSTAGAAGLELAYQKAQESFDDEGVNRVILATDGDFNVGFSSPAEMKRFIAKKRETGIFLSVLGFGQGNYKDDLIQSLAQNGNGVAAYIDTLSEANKVLADEAGSALITIAKDVKIQVEFNPDTISEYRLIGYETRALKRQDFNNDKVDAGEIGAGHTVTAIYELTPVGSPAKVFDPLRYVDSKLNTTGSNEFAFVKIRHKLPHADKSTLQTFPIGPRQERSLKRSSNDMRFATAVAAVGQKLRGDTHLEDFSYDEAINLAVSAKGEDEHGYRAEFIQLIRLAKGLKE